MTQDGNESSKHLLINQRHLRNAKLIEDLLASEVYRELVGPDIDEMVARISGGKRDGFFFAGDIEQRKCTPEDRTWLAGYQAALIELSMKWYQYIRKGKQVAGQMAQETNQQEPDQMETPLMEDYDEGA